MLVEKKLSLEALSKHSQMLRTDGFKREDYYQHVKHFRLKYLFHFFFNQFFAIVFPKLLVFQCHHFTLALDQIFQKLQKMQQIA